MKQTILIFLLLFGGNLHGQIHDFADSSTLKNDRVILLIDSLSKTKQINRINGKQIIIYDFSYSPSGIMIFHTKKKIIGYFLRNSGKNLDIIRIPSYLFQKNKEKELFLFDNISNVSEIKTIKNDRISHDFFIYYYNNDLEKKELVFSFSSILNSEKNKFVEHISFLFELYTSIPKQLKVEKHFVLSSVP